MNGLFNILLEKSIKNLQQWLLEEEYDSDAVEYDMDNVTINSFVQTNIGNQLKDKSLYQTIIDFIHDAKC